jgi:pimeloyl-ACP methyl ester carboxylesterase
MPQPRGRMIRIGNGRNLHAVVAGPRGPAPPTVLLEAGAFGFSADWAAVQEKLAAEGLRSLAYDRAGLGFSDPGPEPRDGLAIVEDLERLLEADGEAGPFILCGHSMAGLHVRLFAARNRARVIGLVLVDATTPEAMDSKLVSGIVEQFGRATRLAAWGAQAGILKSLAGSLGDSIGLDGRAGDEKRWAFALPRHNRWAAEEVVAWPASARQAREAGELDADWPVAVVLAGAPRGRGSLGAMQSAPARASRHGSVEHVAGASHATMLGGAYADAIVRGVNHVRAAAGR